ncbi:cadherin domain-containing protein [Microvirga antarctica]|uniref:cadherin domain-containing protein n=1 Tax=Microvirga antarctica TaxID=2819233 RepID=UPI001B3036D8|nr:cadherin domain-containing protein [Microvirga antarctica]
MPDSATTLTIDASAAVGNFDLETFLADFYSGLPVASYAFYGGTPDQAYGQTYYMNGSQLAFTFANSNKIVLIDGVDLAYDGIHSPGNGHGITGTINSITFGTTNADTQPSDGAAGHGVLTGVNSEVVFSGWATSSAVGAGTLPSNAVYTLYNQLLKGGTDAASVPALAATIAGYTHQIIGSQFDDALAGGAYNDTIDGGNGQDTISLDGQRADYQIVRNNDASFTITDQRSGAPNGVDTVKNVESFAFADGVVAAADLVAPDSNDPDPASFMTIDASGASTGINVEAYIRGGFLSDTTGGGMPVFDNGSTFSGAEMIVGFGNTAASKYVLAHGSLEYYFGTHTVWGEINTIEYGTRGGGTYDSNGFFSGGDVELKITGLSLVNAKPANATDEAEIELNGPVHNFALAHMYGAAADAAKLAKYADALDGQGQHFIGSAFADVYGGTDHDDWIEGKGGADQILASRGNDTIDGGADSDTVIFTGAKADYTLAKDAGGIVTVVRKDGLGTTTLRNTEIAHFSDVAVDLDTLAEEAAGQPPQDVALSNLAIAENAAVGTVVGTLSATDPEGKAVTYRLTNAAGDRFALVDNAIVVHGALDYESFGHHLIGVEARDADGNATAATFTIAVTDVNEAPSQLFLSKAHISENAEVGTRIGTLSALDPEGDAIKFSLLSNAAGRFKLVGNKIELANGLDFEKAQSHTITVQATDAKGLSIQQKITIAVDDVAETIVAKSSGGTTKGGTGVDLIRGSARNDKIHGGGGNDKLSGGHGKDALFGDAGSDRLYGGNDADRLSGGIGNDTLYGQAGNDRLSGDAGADKLFGGAGADTFVFSKLRDSTVATSGRDTIGDFSFKAGDRIDLAGIDANVNRTGNQAFSFIGKSDFHGKSGELRYEKVAGHTYVYGDVDGDGLPDFSLHLNGSHAVTKAYFIL